MLLRIDEKEIDEARPYTDIIIEEIRPNLKYDWVNFLGAYVGILKGTFEYFWSNEIVNCLAEHPDKLPIFLKDYFDREK